MPLSDALRHELEVAASRRSRRHGCCPSRCTAPRPSSTPSTH